MSDEFQPFHTWLGLDKNITNPSFYELLGISPVETDKATIASAADVRLKKLQAVPHGEHEPTRIRLVAQVNQAKNCLLDDEQRRGYDTRLKAAIKAGLIDNATATSKGEKPNGAAQQVESAIPVSESAWPPGYAPSGNDLPPKATESNSTVSTVQEKERVQLAPEKKASAAVPPSPASRAPNDSSSLSNPAIPVVSAPIDDDLPQPIVPQPTQQAEVAAAGSDNDLPPMSIPTSVPAANPAIANPAATVAPPNPASAAVAPRSEDSTGLPVPIPAQPIPAQPAPTQPAPTQPAPFDAIPVQAVSSEPVGQIPVARAIYDQPIAPQPIAAQPIAAQPIAAQPIAAQPIAPQPIAPQPIAAQPIASQPIAAQSGVAADPTAQPTPSIGGSGTAAERYRTLRRRSQIKAAIGGLLVLVFLGVGGFVAYKYRDSWLPMTKSPNFKDEKSGDMTVAKIDPADVASKSDSDAKANDEKAKSDKADNTNSVLVPIEKPETNSDTEPDAKSDDPSSMTKDGDKPNIVGPDTVVPDDPKPDPDDPAMATDAEDSPAEQAKRLKDVAVLGKLLESAKQALFDRKLIEADRLIADAEPLVTSPEHKEVVTRLKGVADQIDVFWKTVIDECGKMQSLDEIAMSTSIIVVVESSPEKFVFRSNGERSEYRPIELPLGLAMKIAERTWDPPTAESRITRGTVYVIDGMLGREPANIKKARDIFEEAALVGGNAEPFLDFIEDDYDLVSALIVQEDAPDEKEVAEASEKLKEEYRKNFSSSDRVALARQLLEDAPGMADLPSRMAAFDLAADLASATAEIPLLVELVDTQAKWFKTDSDEVKASRLEDVVKKRMSVEMAKELTRTAFELVEWAREAKNLELAARYVKVSVSAAAKSKDADLKSAAAELNLQIREELRDQK